MDSETPEPSHCASCGAALRPAAKFCTRCGTATASSAPSPAPAEVPKVQPAANRLRELSEVAWLYGLLLLSSLCFGIAYHFNPEADFLPWQSLVFGAVILCFAIPYRSEITPLLRPSTFDRNARRKLAIAAGVQFVALGAVFYLLEQTGIPLERITDEMQRHDYSLWQLLVLCSLVPAVVEEVAFRGILFGRLRLVLGEREAWLVQAAFFSILHLSPVIFLTHFAMGLIFGWLRMRTGSLLPGMILHAAWNASVILIELYY